MTLIGATAVMAFGASALNDARSDSLEGSTQHALTQLDSRSAMVALGDSVTQRISLASTADGSYRVDADAGSITITHRDYDGAGNDTVLYNATLGALVYDNGQTHVAYQGGGIWRSTDAGSRMVSPPEFHYQSTTLTLPVIRVAGDSNGGTGRTATVRSTVRAHRIYPNQTNTYPETNDSYVNPVRDGNVTVTIQSAYYDAWADFFRTRTDGEVTVDATNRTVSVKLTSQGTVGDFDMPADGNSVELVGLGDGHPIDEFTIRLRPDDEDSADFSNLKWSLYAEQGSQRFEIHLRSGTENDDPDTGDCTERYVKTSVYYSETNGDPYHGWFNDTAFTTSCADLNGDGDNETYLDVNLTGTTKLSMEQLSSSQLGHFSPNGDDSTDPINFSEHAGEPNADWEPKEFSETDDDTSVNNLTNHYLSLMGPNVELFVEDSGADTVTEESSEGRLTHSGGSGSFITYLHITENEIEVSLD